MIWRTTIPGQPISVNHLYIPVWRKDKRQRLYKGRAYSPEARKYFEDAVLIMRTAKPAHWAPEGQVRVFYDLYLQREIDSDNVLKVLSDALQAATGVNDRRMLPCIRSTQLSSPSQARVQLEIDDQQPLLLPVPASSPKPPTPSGSSSHTSRPVRRSSSAAG